MAQIRERNIHDRVIKAGEQSATDPMAFILSTETVDRVGDVIEAKGWNLREFRSNPIALFQHNHNLPIGVWEGVRVEGKKLIGHLKMARKGTSRLVDEVHALLEQRILKAVSVGFSPDDYDEIKDAKGQWTGGYRFTKVSLLEASLVSVPANPDAVSLAKSLGVSAETLDRVFRPVGRGLGASSIGVAGKGRSAVSRLASGGSGGGRSSGAGIARVKGFHKLSPTAQRVVSDVMRYGDE